MSDRTLPARLAFYLCLATVALAWAFSVDRDIHQADLDEWNAREERYYIYCESGRYPAGGNVAELCERGQMPGIETEPEVRNDRD